MPWEGGTQAPGPIRGSGLACSGPNRVGRLVPAWCVGCLWSRVGWGEIQQLMPTLGPVWFTEKNIFFWLVCPFPPLLRWERGEGEKVRINGPHRPQRPRSVWPCSLPHPSQATCCPFEFSLLLSFLLWEALKSLKGHQGVRDTVANHRACPDPASSPSGPPPSTAQLCTPRAVTHVAAFLWAQP